MLLIYLTFIISIIVNNTDNQSETIEMERFVNNDSSMVVLEEEIRDLSQRYINSSESDQPETIPKKKEKKNTSSNQISCCGKIVIYFYLLLLLFFFSLVIVIPVLLYIGAGSTKK